MKCLMHNIPLVCHRAACRGEAKSKRKPKSSLKTATGRQPEGQQDAREGEAMIYKRGGVYWFRFRWTVKGENDSNMNYLTRKSARATNKKDAGDTENEHKRALRLGMMHPSDPWPAPEKQAPQVPTVRSSQSNSWLMSKCRKRPEQSAFTRFARSRLAVSCLGRCRSDRRDRGADRQVCAVAA